MLSLASAVQKYLDNVTRLKISDFLDLAVDYPLFVAKFLEALENGMCDVIKICLKGVARSKLK